VSLLACCVWCECVTSFDRAARNPLFKSRPKIFGVGGALRPKGSTNLYRFVKWPRYVKLQRQKQVLLNRIKVPPAINQFRHTLEKNHSTELFRLLNKYKPESPQDKKKRLLEEAKVGMASVKSVSFFSLLQWQTRSEGKEVSKSKPTFVKYGLQNVTSLVEQGEAKLVVIAHDVDPIELVVWLPTLCQKKNIPYVIVKGKAKLGQVVGKKNLAVAAFSVVNAEDRATLNQLAETARTNFNDRAAFFRKTWGGLALGVKSAHRRTAREKIAREEAEAQKTLNKKSAGKGGAAVASKAKKAEADE
jgi:large subunit ribosomal protein L7Ae